MKKQIWCEKSGCWQEKNLSSNRIALDYIKKAFRTESVNATKLAEGLGVDRQTGWNMLRSLYKSGYLKTKKLTSWKRVRDSREYTISKKGLTKMPRKKGIIKEPEIKIVEKPVEVTKTERIERIIKPLEEI